MSDKATIYEALAGAMADVEAVAKTGWNDAQKFKFRGIDAVMNAVHTPLTKHGVIPVPVVLDQVSEEYETSKGAHMRLVSLRVRYDFFGPDGSNLSATVVGEAADSGDKAASKAMAMAFKYALFQVLCLPTGDEDPDGQSHERGGSSQRTVTRSAPQPNGQATEAQRRAIGAMVNKLGIPDESKRSYVAELIGLPEPVASKDLTKRQASDLIGALKKELGEE